MNKLIKFIAIFFAIIIFVLLGILAFVNPPQKTATTVSTPATPGYPTSPNGHVQIFNPVPGQTIISPETVSGSVTGGGWFFEATFSVRVVDADGTVLGEGQAQAQSDWTSTGTVLFMGAIPFSVSHSATGTIVFSKDNPSGLPQDEESFSVPIKFQQ
ncbi:MAG: Gmad2 immunoglobulin-like domain-containing protein [Minisyncoccia bacterium]|jgi:hypothetical protein